MSSHQYGYDYHAFLYWQRPSQTNCKADIHSLYRSSACTGAPGSRRFWALTWAKENSRHSSSAPSVPGLALSTPIRSLQSQSPETHNGGSCSISSPGDLKLAHVSLDFDEGNATSPRTPDNFSRFGHSIFFAKILRTSPGIVGFAGAWPKTVSSSGLRQPARTAWASRLRLLDFPVPDNLRGSPELLVITEGLVAVDVVALKQGDARVQLEG